MIHVTLSSAVAGAPINRIGWSASWVWLLLVSGDRLLCYA
jgi:hypothetical protein